MTMPFRSFNDLVADAKRRIHEVDADELAELMEPGSDVPELLVIDVREADERGRGFIPGSIGIPRGILERDVAKVAFGGTVGDADLGRPIVTVCGGGSRSALAADALRAMGFGNVQSLAGGFGAWGKAGKPVEHPRSH
jgi:rhodanese-related sulfurtransferase